MAARLIVQLLRMLRTPEEEIAELLNRKPMMAVGQEPSAELVRKLCMLQLDIIADMATATAELRASYRRQIDQLWQAHLAQDEVVNGTTKSNGIPSKSSHVSSASLSSRSSSSSSSVSSSSSTSSSSEDISKAQPLIDLSNGDESTFSGKKEELITKKKKSSAVSSDDDDNSNNSCTSRTSSSSNNNNNNKDTDLTTSSGSAENRKSSLEFLFLFDLRLPLPSKK